MAIYGPEGKDQWILSEESEEKTDELEKFINDSWIDATILYNLDKTEMEEELFKEAFLNQVKKNFELEKKIIEKIKQMKSGKIVNQQYPIVIDENTQLTEKNVIQRNAPGIVIRRISNYENLDDIKITYGANKEGVVTDNIAAGMIATGIVENKNSPELNVLKKLNAINISDFEKEIYLPLDYQFTKELKSTKKR